MNAMRCCYVTDRTAFAGNEAERQRRLLARISEAASAGVDYIQLREKDLPMRELELLARAAMSIVANARRDHGVGTALLINSRSDVALAAHADGVHLRSDDISPLDVRKVWDAAHPATPALISVSCHTPEETTRAAANGANFAHFAPVFGKISIPATKPAGLDALRKACRAGIPVLALGGVTLENAPDCLKAGAAGIAAIRLFQENNIADVVRRLRSL